jgi:hypothetical protein
MLIGAQTQRARPRRRLAVSLVVLFAAPLAACGGSSSSSIASKSPSEILSASRAAAAGASSVHLTATSGEVTLDMNLTRTGGTGRLTLSHASLEMTRIGNVLYLKAPPAILGNLRLPTSLPANTWLKVPAEKKPQLAAFSEMNAQLNLQLQIEGPLTKGATTTVNGQRVIEVKQAAKLLTRTLYIAASGKPYPVEVLVKGQVRGNTTFSEWDKPVTLAPPAKSIDISQLQK